jgi:hypothetical protein
LVLMMKSPFQGTRRQTMDSLCAKCGTAFSCGMIAGETHCWCADLPKLIPLDANADACFCPACLKQEIAALNSPPIEA